MSAKANSHLPSEAAETPEKSLERLRYENNKLQRLLEARTQENALLNEVISTVGSTLRLEEVLKRLLEAINRATSCDIATIYLYDPEKDLLVLSSATGPYEGYVGKIHMTLGEGITGWAALHRKPIFLKEAALADPRFHYIPEFQEEKFQSIFSVPIIAKDKSLTGVITLQAVAPHEFSKQQRNFISNIAALVTGAIENAQLYESAQRKLSILTSLSMLSQTISSGLYLDDMLRTLATLTVQIMEVDLCVIMLMDQARERDADTSRQLRRLIVHATAPNWNDQSQFQAVDVDPHTLDHLRSLSDKADLQTMRAYSSEAQDLPEGETLERLNPLRTSQYKSLISAPLIAGTEQLGLINCYTYKARRFNSENQTLLTTIANQVAIAIKNSRLVNQLAQKNLVKGFFEDLIQGLPENEESLRQRAHFLGCDLTQPHAVVRIEMTRGDESTHPTSGRKEGAPSSSALQNTYRSLGNLVRRRIQESAPGSIFYEHENLLNCLLPLPKDSDSLRLKTWIQELAHHIYDEYDVRLAVGLGNACQQISDYRQGFAEASEALQMGQSMHSTERGPAVTHFNDLGVYRYLYKIAHMDDLRDVYQEQVAKIDEYDKRKNTELLTTLEMYLENAGNLTKTAEHLYVHRNTLIQRLERIQSLCSIDLQERSNWLTFQVAIKIYRLRME
ncbi:MULTISPECIES: GAF domain-containing protein [Ktedonobacter]|uniref:GAF domain-containing protein n=1 Tax=Ktedonobacter robiniae TaxID=2778365 RepID=A0ABQ3UH57_9CHLR|nr:MULTISPECIES: GAF domain-containing protein [Ktedonobacter]GHO52039.1 hypothetical protein KSB_05140 [Ktedonobacter robiniae]GHO65519.1 hypothetical protein KSC_044110 [Ktedonobacter sp. SOSP1-52]